MSSFKKMVLMPEDASEEEEEFPKQIQDGHGIDDDFQSPPQTSQKKGNTIRDYALDRQRRLLQIVMRIASINGYNENMNIKDKNGKFVEGTDIIPLILYSVTKERLVKGIDSYVDLLVEAKVPPEVITNENLRQRLINAGHAGGRQRSETATRKAADVENETAVDEPVFQEPVAQEPVVHIDKTRKPKRKRNEISLEPLAKIRRPETRSRKRKAEEDISDLLEENKTKQACYEGVSDSEDDD